MDVGISLPKYKPSLNRTLAGVYIVQIVTIEAGSAIRAGCVEFRRMVIIVR